MKTAIIQGVPLAMQRDGWWLNDPETPKRPDKARRLPGGAGPIRLALLAALVALADVLMWQVAAGLSLAVFCAILGGVAIWVAGVSRDVAIKAGGGVLLAVLPLVELVQPLSVLILVAGLSLVFVFVAGLRNGALGWGALRLWWNMPIVSVRDAVRGAESVGELNIARIDVGGTAARWALPVGLGGVFAILLIGANPVLDGWIAALGDIRGPEINLGRWFYWVLLAALVWPCLRLAGMKSNLTPRAARQTVRRQGLINAGSVTRSLILFNAMFAVQTVMDLVLLYGGAGLPEGMSYAAYAHRGAYPLLATALLAGGFAILARPFADEKPVLRMLLLVWLGQTLALVLASVVRLEVYIDVYGLTRLRIAALIWMAVVAAGLGVTVWQVVARKHTGWMMARSAAIGAVTLYLCSFVNFAGVIAQYNLSNGVGDEGYYICRHLGEGALPAIAEHEATKGVRVCKAGTYTGRPKLFEAADWREWGFRNARLRRSLGRIEAERVIP